MNPYWDLIRQAPLISAISADKTESFLKDGSFRTAAYRKQYITHFAGEPCTRLEIILDGKVAVERIDESGALMTIAEFAIGDILGGNLLFSKNPRYPMTITVKEPAIILEIGKTRLFQLFSDNSEILRSYLEFMSDHTAILGDQINRYVNKTIRESITGYLDYERKKQHSNHIRLSVTKKALAEKIGVQRTSLSRELAKMREDGLIQFDAESIDILP